MVVWDTCRDRKGPGGDRTRSEDTCRDRKRPGCALDTSGYHGKEQRRIRVEFKGKSDVSIRLIFIKRRKTTMITSRSSRERVTLNLLDLPNDLRAEVRCEV